MRAARDLKQIVSDCVHGDVCLTVCNKNTNATVQLKASCKTVAPSSYIRAAARFSSDSSGGCVGHVTILVDCKSAWCPEEALHFLETGRLNPTVWNSQRRLLVLLEFADYLGIDALIDGCLQCLQLHMQSVERPAHWSTIAYFQECTIPDSITGSPCWPPCCNLALLQAEHAMQDMEQVLATVEGCRRLLTLSFKTLLHVCRSCNTRVAYESTVVLAITTWCAAHPEASQEQLYDLASTVCLRGLPRTYLATVLTQLPWWRHAITEGVLLQATQLLTYVSSTCDPSSGCDERHDAGSPTSTSPAASSSSCLSDGSSRKARRTLDSVLQHMSHDDQNMYKLLLRQPREASQTHSLRLSAVLSKQQLQHAYLAKTSDSGSGHNGNSSNWQHASRWQTFAGTDWQLMFRFVLGGSQRSPSWQLAVGIRFFVQGVLNPSAVSLQLPTLHLDHPLAIAPGPPLTRLQLEQHGLDPDDGTHLLPAGAVLTCREVLPLSLTGDGWCTNNLQLISRYLDDGSCVPVAVTVKHIL